MTNIVRTQSKFRGEVLRTVFKDLGNGRYTVKVGTNPVIRINYRKATGNTVWTRAGYEACCADLISQRYPTPEKAYRHALKTMI